MAGLSNPAPSVRIGLADPTTGGNFVIGTSLLGTGTIAASAFQFAEFTGRLRTMALRRGRGHPQDPMTAGGGTLELINTSGELQPSDFRPGLPVEILANGVCVFSGKIVKGHRRLDPLTTLDTINLVVADGIRDLEDTTLPPVTAVGATDSPGDRIDRVLDMLEDPPADPDRNLDAGQGTMPASTFPDSLLAHALEAVEAEAGLLFNTRTGGWRFYGRDHFVDPTIFDDPVVDLGADGYRFQASDAPWSSDRVLNDVQLTRPGGVAQRAIDSDSISLYGRKVRSAEVQLGTDTQVDTLCTDLVTRFKDATIEAEVINVHGGRDMWPGVVGVLELGDPVTVTRNSVTRNCIVEGISHAWSYDQGWQLQLTVFEVLEQLSSAFVLGTSLIGTGTIGNG